MVGFRSNPLLILATAFCIVPKDVISRRIELEKASYLGEYGAYDDAEKLERFVDTSVVSWYTTAFRVLAGLESEMQESTEFWKRGGNEEWSAGFAECARKAGSAEFKEKLAAHEARHVSPELEAEAKALEDRKMEEERELDSQIWDLKRELEEKIRGLKGPIYKKYGAEKVALLKKHGLYDELTGLFAGVGITVGIRFFPHFK